MTVTILEPTTGAKVSGQLTVRASYSGPQPVAATLTVDNKQVATSPLSSIFFSFDTTAFIDGGHQLGVHVRYVKSKTGNKTIYRWDHAYVDVTFANAPQPAPLGDLTFPIRTTFWYGWYPETWKVWPYCNKSVLTHVQYRPTIGTAQSDGSIEYDSADPRVIDYHIRSMDYAGIKLAVLSWWGRDGSRPDSHRESTIFPRVLDRTAALGSKLRWCPYYEKEGFGDPSAAEIKSDLDYILARYGTHPNFARIAGGKPMAFVYSADDSGKGQQMLDRWKQAATGWWYCPKVFLGYKTLANQPSHWHQYGPDVREDRQGGFSFSIAPGRTDPKCPPILARDLTAWKQNVANMKASNEPLQIILTFNEWGEGTAVESAQEWSSSSGFGAYLDALHAV